MMCGSRPTAEDAVQEALARAWERMDRGVHIDSVTAWVTTVAMNLSRSGLRRIRAERRAKDKIRVLAGTDVGGPTGDRIDVVRALAELPRRQREATILRYYLDLTVQEIARAMNVSEGTAKSTLARARQKLAETLGSPQEADEEADSHA